jgi:hypothetical protein
MLYNTKPNLGSLCEWGNEVWVHTTEGTKLEGQSRMGKWIGFDEISNGHRIYWPEKCSVTVEHSIKFVNGDAILPPILVAQPIQGEKRNMNPQCTPEITKSEDQGRTKSPTIHQQPLDNPIPSQTTEEIEIDQSNLQ